MLSRAITPKRRGRNWLTALAALSILTGTLVFSSTSLALTQSEFELDKDATGDVVSLHLGTLKSSVTNSATSITVCTFVGGVYPAAPFTILIDGEQMTVTALGATSNKTGGCGFGDPALIASGTQAYTVTRGVNSSTAAAHSGGADVTRLVSGVVSGEDWSQVYASVTADANDEGDDDKCIALGAVECAYIADPKATDETYFTGGGSKDDLDINDQGDPAVPDGPWLNTDSSVPPSDEILDGFAAKYIDSNDHELLFFGADRWTTNGAKDFGFWFFKNPVAADTVTNTFSGTHAVGDILILGTFTQGGAVSSIRVFSWVGSGGDVNGVLQTEGNFGDCVPGGGTGNGCNTVNDTTIKSPWPYQGGNTGNVANSIYSGGMLEGGIDLTAMGLTGCFSSFMAETRSSPSIGAQLKDFVLGTFEACGSSITTQITDADGIINPGDSITDTATLNVTGGGPAPTGFIDFYVCGPEADIASCDDTGTAAGHINLSTAVVSGSDYTVTSSTVTPASAGDYCFYAEYPAGQDPNYPAGAFLTDFSDECFTVTPAQPTISTTATSATPDPLGTVIDDVAHLGGTANQPDGDPAGGTITFTAYGPFDALNVCTGTAVYTSVVAVSGDGDYTASDGDADADGTAGEVPDDQFIPTAAGTYNWIAVYSGDAPNTLGVSGACADENEGSVVISLQPTIATEQTFVLHDEATITVASGAGGDLSGSVRFRLYNNATCDTTSPNELLYDSNVNFPSGVAVSGSGTFPQSDTVSSEEITITTSAPVLSWLVEYTSGNPAHKNVTSSCNVENSSVSIDNS